jgi:hypothetical protein
VRVPHGELLRHPTSEGDADDVGLRKPELVEEVHCLAGEAMRTQRHEPRGRVAGARSVVGDRLETAVVELACERRPHLDVPAETHDEQDQVALTGHDDPQQVPIHAGEGA